MYSKQNTYKVVDELQLLETFCIEGNVNPKIAAILACLQGAILSDSEKNPAIDEIAVFVNDFAERQIEKLKGNK